MLSAYLNFLINCELKPHLKIEWVEHIPCIAGHAHVSCWRDFDDCGLPVYNDDCQTGHVSETWKLCNISLYKAWLGKPHNDSSLSEPIKPSSIVLSTFLHHHIFLNILVKKKGNKDCNETLRATFQLHICMIQIWCYEIVALFVCLFVCLFSMLKQ